MKRWEHLPLLKKASPLKDGTRKTTVLRIVAPTIYASRVAIRRINIQLRFSKGGPLTGPFSSNLKGRDRLKLFRPFVFQTPRFEFLRFHSNYASSARQSMIEQQRLLIKEIFKSIQGEGSHTGLPFHFIRLSGCNLRCSYCDTSYAFKGGELMSHKEILDQIPYHSTPYILVTGGEPLMQSNTPSLIEELLNRKYKVCLETHGEISLKKVPKDTHIIMDIKTPGSQMNRGEFKNNFQFLKHTDEIKFVITSENDFEWAKEILFSHPLPTKNILFSPALQAPKMPGGFKSISPAGLAEKIIQQNLPVRFQLQLHKQLWGDECKR